MQEFSTFAYAIGEGSEDAILALERVVHLLQADTGDGHPEPRYYLAAPWFEWDEDCFDGPPRMPFEDCQFVIEGHTGQFLFTSYSYWEGGIVEALLVAWQKHFHTGPIFMEELLIPVSWGRNAPGDGVGFAATIVKGEVTSISTWEWMESRAKALGVAWPPQVKERKRPS